MMILRQILQFVMYAVIFYVLFRFAKLIVEKVHNSRYKKHMEKLRAIEERDKLDEARSQEIMRKRREREMQERE